MELKDFNRFPVAIIGDKVEEFKSTYNDAIEHVTNTAELRNIIEYYSGIKALNHPLVIEDISLIRDAGSDLLKFLEESKLDIILLCKNDTLSPVLASRILTIIKSRHEVTSQFLSVKEAYMEITETECADIYNQIDLYKKYCPYLYIVTNTIKDKKLLPVLCWSYYDKKYNKH